MRALALGITAFAAAAVPEGVAAQQKPAGEKPIGGATAAASARRAHVFRLAAAAPLDAPPDALPDVLRQPLTLRLPRVTVEHALHELAARGVHLSYSRAVVPLDRVVSVDVDGAPVLEALRQTLAGADVELWVSAEGRMALVPAAPAGAANASGAPAAAVTPNAAVLGAPAAAAGAVAGRVLADGGGPLADVAVRVAGTALGARSGPDGRYAIGGVPAGTHTLVVQRVGYGRDSARVDVGANLPARADFALRHVATQLREVVAIGYGTAARRDITGAVAVVGDEFKTPAAPVVTLTHALQGRAAGVHVVTNSGLPGAGARVRVRGTGSISANAEPLYVIDGLPAVQGTGSTNPQDNPLLSVDPSEIASVQVLKDASATAIYGARGANGVVLVQTRRGQRGARRLTLESSAGWQRAAARIPVLDAPDFMRLANEARATAGLPALYTQAAIDTAVTHDYPGMMLRAAPQSSHSASVSGGDRRVRYLVGANYAGQQGIAIGSDFRRLGARLNLDADATPRLRLGANVGAARAERNAAAVESGSLGNSANGLQAAMQFDPSQAPRDATGAWVKTASTTEPVPNPVANASELTDLHTSARLLGSAFAEYDLAGGLRLRSTLGGNYQDARVDYLAPRTILAGGVSGVTVLQTGRTRDLTSENTLTYREHVGPGTLTAVGGVSGQRFHTEARQTGNGTLPGDRPGGLALGTNAQLLPSGSAYERAVILSYLGRADYALADRYLFTVTARRDGSSRFGARNKWATFPSAAVAWRVSGEPFVQGLRGGRGLGELKLRASYGRAGNQAVGAYQSLATLGTTYYSFGGVEVPALAPTSAAPNPRLRWERKTSLNVGVDATALGDRVALSLDAYRDVTDDLLLAVALPATTGYATQLQNVGAVGNRGVELSLSTVNVARGRFSWRTTLTVAGNRNRVLDLGAQDSILVAGRMAQFFNPGQTHIVREGAPLGSIYGFVVDGLWQQGDACTLDAASECAPGELRVRDLNGDRVITAADRRVLGHADPTYFGGLANDFALGPITVGAFVSFSRGNRVVNAGAAFGALAIGQANERAVVRDRWTPENTDAAVPRANNARPRRLYSTLVEDGSYLRLQSLSLGYELPRRLVPRARATRVYVTGQNVFVLTRYTGFDPDVNSFGGDARLGGVDLGAYPRQRAWNAGAAVTF